VIPSQPDNIWACFSDVEDPRIDRTKDHPLINLLVIAVCGVLCGADGWSGIEAFGQAKEKWLEHWLDLTNGIPSHDTFGRTFARIDPEQFQNGFTRWVAMIAEVTEGEVIAIDGKQSRCSHNRGIGKGAIHMVSAWATANHLVLGQRKTDEKSNEITAIPKLLEMLHVKGCVITIDAMGCQHEIGKAIVQREGDYVLALKGNQAHINEDVTGLFNHFEKTAFRGVEHTYSRTVNSGHGRVEIRECWAFEVTKWARYIRNLKQWPHLKSVAMVRAERRVGEKVTVENRFFLSSLDADAKRILECVRCHWGIENSLHWVLDVAFREDESRIRKGYAAENMAVLRHIALNMLRQEKSRKAGIYTKRLMCALDQEYLLKVLQAGADQPI
jgi:predicted transposase YbfD/YdcC